MTSIEKIRYLYPKAIKRLRQIIAEAITHRSITFPPELRHIHELDVALQNIERRWPATGEAEADTERPVFLLSAGWRSGSTLLQRLICSSGEIVIWGEPLGDAALIPRMANSLTALTDVWPPENYFAHDLALGSFSENWIANVTPPIASLRNAHRALLDEWLAKPAREIHGTALWGLKEVRLTIEHARYLKWLYPKARFVFIYRNLFDAYRSWRGNAWASTWPGYFSWSPIAYARHWKLLLTGYLDGWQEIGGYLIKYEDLVAGTVDLTALAAYLGVSRIDSSVLEKRIGSPVDNNKRKRPKKWVTPVEKLLLSLTAGKILKRAGYKQ